MLTLSTACLTADG